MADLNIETNLMRKSVGDIQTASDDLHSTTGGFQQQIASYGQPWGNDMLGALIGGCYMAIHELAFGSYDDNNRGIDNHAQKVNDMATTYDKGEKANVDNVNGVV